MSKTTEQRRHEALAKATASWRSWAVNNWFTNGSMAVELDQPFRGQPMQLDYECMCSDFDKRQHRHRLDRLCVYVDEYTPAATMGDALSAVLLKAKGDGQYARLDIEDELIEAEDEPGLLVYRARINEDMAERAWVGLNKRFVDAIRAEARPSRWWLAGLRGVPVGQEMPANKAPAVIAVRGERMVGVVMPLACSGSAIEAGSVEVEAP